MKYRIPDPADRVSVDSFIKESPVDIASQEGFLDFCKKAIVRIGVFFKNQAAMSAYINENMKLFEDLNPKAIVKTVITRDLSLVANALTTINEGLEKLRLGNKIDLMEFTSDALEKVGIVYERGRISTARFQSGDWGEGKDKDGLDHPMVWNKTCEEFGWTTEAKRYAEKFIELSKTTSKGELLAASNRHYTDVKNAMAKGLSRNMAIFDKEVAVDQINQLNICRDTLLKFYFKQLRAIMKGANIQPIGEVPAEITVVNSYQFK